MDNFVETVRVVSEVSPGNPHGYVKINASDLTSEHKLFDGPEATATPISETTSIDLVVSHSESDEVGLSDNDGAVTASTGGKKPWEVQS